MFASEDPHFGTWNHAIRMWALARRTGVVGGATAIPPVLFLGPLGLCQEARELHSGFAPRFAVVAVPGRRELAELRLTQS